MGMMMRQMAGMAVILSVMTVLGGRLGSTAAEARALAAPPAIAQVEKELRHSKGTIFPVGMYNAGNAAHFTGYSYAAALTDGKKVPVVNVTFYRGFHTYWHRHFGTCQILVGASGHGYYQIWGQKPQKLEPGQTVTIPEGVKHWHGAAPGQNFQHVVVMEPGSHTTQWLEPVDEKTYEALAK